MFRITMFMCINALGRPMNIFITDTNPRTAAENLADVHVVKMALESAQMLSTALYHVGVEENEMPLTKSGTAYKATHKNHPCTIWAQSSRANFSWLAQHGWWICQEYTHRFGKVHACQSPIEQMWGMDKRIPEGDMTPFAQAMPDEFKHESAVVAYRQYYIEGKSEIAKWDKGRSAPTWFKRH